MKILVTGFDPFGTEQINPALEAVKCLPARINGAEIIALEVPTVFGESAVVLANGIAKYQPDYVLAVGQAGGRSGLTPERVAINIDDARIADNQGNQPIDQPIQLTGEAAYFSQHPVKAMVASIQAKGLPASLSNTAGTFVCNHLMYQGLYLSHTRYPQVKVGFIHVPFLPSQVTEKPHLPALSLAEIVAGLEAALEVIVAFDGQPDLQTIGGALH